jgi:hypothetical protein
MLTALGDKEGVAIFVEGLSGKISSPFLMIIDE